MARESESRLPAGCEELFRAVCESPDDDGPRVRYAACLEATGDPDAALRAEYIRVRCELARSRPSDDRWEELQERKSALDPHLDRWAAMLPKLDGVGWNVFDFARGFVWDVWCDDAEAYQRNAAVIFAAAPVQSLSFRRLESVAPILDVPETVRLRRLIVEGFRLTPADARTLADAGSVSRLTALHLADNRLGDAGAKPLAASPHLLRLDTLDLARNGIGDAGVAALAASPVVSSLSNLGLAGNPLTNVGALALASSPRLLNLTGLTLWECRKIGAKGKEVLKARFGGAVSFLD